MRVSERLTYEKRFGFFWFFFFFKSKIFLRSALNLVEKLRHRVDKIDEIGRRNCVCVCCKSWTFHDCLSDSKQDIKRVPTVRGSTISWAAIISGKSVRLYKYRQNGKERLDR